jgi:hypothetical protein
VVETYEVHLLITKDLREQLPPKCEGWVSADTETSAYRGDPGTGIRGIRGDPGDPGTDY